MLPVIRVWQIYQQLSRQYQSTVLDGASHRSKLTHQDFRDRVLSKQSTATSPPCSNRQPLIADDRSLPLKGYCSRLYNLVKYQSGLNNLRKEGADVFF